MAPLGVRREGLANEERRVKFVLERVVMLIGLAREVVWEVA